MPTLTGTQRRARADAIVIETERTGCTPLEAIKRVNARMFGETTRRAPVTETTRPTEARAMTAAQIAKAVVETLTAAGAPSLPPGTTFPATAAAKAVTPAAPLHQADDDQLAAAAARSFAANLNSPFWRDARESAPSAPVSETTAGAEDLTRLTEAELADRYAERGRTFLSPIWA